MKTHTSCLLVLVLFPLLLSAQGLQKKLKFRIDSLLESTERHFENVDDEQAFKCACTALDLCIPPYYRSIEILDTFIKASINISDSKLKALQLTKALAIAQKCKYREAEGNCYMELGLYLKNFEHLTDSAIACFSKALKIRESLPKQEKVASVYNNMSSAYLDLHKFEDAKECSQRAIDILSKLDGHTNMLISAYNNYANAENDLGHFHAAIALNKKAIQLLEAEGENADTSSLVNAYYGLGERYFHLGSFIESCSAFNHCAELAKEFKDFQTLGMAKNGLGVCNFESNFLDKAEANFKEAIDILKSDTTYTDSVLMARIYFNLGNLYQARQDFVNSKNCYHKSLEFLNGKAVAEIKLDDAIRGQLRVIEIARKKSLYQNIGILIAVLFLFSLFFLYYQMATKRAENMALQEKVLIEREAAIESQRQLNETQKEVLNLREEGIKAREEIQRLRDIHHLAIKDHLNIMLVHLKSGDLDVFQFKALVEDSIERLRSDPFAKPEPIQLGSFTELMHARAKFKAGMDVALLREIDDAYFYNLSGPVRVNLEAIIGLAFTNIRNSAQATLVSLKFEMDGTSLIVEIKDNGVGFELDRVPDGKRGVADIFNKAKEMGAECRFDTSPGNGTRIAIAIPSPFVFSAS